MRTDVARRGAAALAWFLGLAILVVASERAFTILAGTSNRGALLLSQKQIKDALSDELAVNARVDVKPLHPDGGAPYQSLVALARLDAGDVAVLDNNRGVIFEITPNTNEVRPSRQVQTHFEFPFGMRTEGGRLYVADTSGLHEFDGSTNTRHLTRWFYTAYDFLPLAGSDRVFVNAATPAENRPLVVEVRGGIKVRDWTPSDRTPEVAPYGSVTWKASLADCGSSVAVAPVNEPAVYILDKERLTARRIELPYPRKEELLALYRDGDLVNPEPGVYELPRFTGGVACAGRRVYVLLDLPLLTIYRATMDGGEPELISFSRRIDGRFWRLMAVRENDAVQLYAIEKHTGGTSGIVRATVTE